MALLTIRSRDGRQFTYELGSTRVRVGRAETCQIVLRNDGEVSREHAELWIGDGARVMVADLNSKNGTRADGGETFRNAVRVVQRRVYIGEHEIEVRGDHNTEATTVVFAAEEPEGLDGTRFFPSSQRPELNQKRLGLLIGLGERLGGTFERKQLLEQAIDACCEALEFERAIIVLKTARGEAELPVTRNMQRDDTGAYKVSRTLINRALVDGERAIVNNPATDVGNITESLVRFPICSALCVPITYREEILGVIYGDRITTASTYRPRDVDFLAAIAQQVGVGLANLRMAQEQVRIRALEQELDQARTIQRMLLPPAPLTVGNVTIEGFNEPSSAVGGDYFDFFELGDGRVGIIIADVTGHGLPAALMMANIQAAVRASMTGDVSLTDLASRINRLICRNTGSDVFITAVIGVVNPASGLIEFVNAGHPPPLLIGGEVRSLSEEHNSLPLGVEPGDTYHVTRIERDPHHDAVLLYTDGLTEAASREREWLGVEGVVDALRQLPERNTGAVIRASRAAVKKHLGGAAPVDDMTLLALHFGA